MAIDPGPWARLIEDHQRNLVRLEATEPDPPLWWALPLGVLAPWFLVLVALAWREPAVLNTAVPCFALLIPVGLGCLFVERLQIVSVGLMVGIGSSLVVAWDLAT